MLTIEKLKNFGANTEEGLGRCFGKEEFYLKLASMAADQTEFEKMAEAIAEGDLKKAFESAHALKGIMGNLSITPIYDKVCEITELLRVETAADYDPLVNEILRLRDEYKALCS